MKGERMKRGFRITRKISASHLFSLIFAIMGLALVAIASFDAAAQNTVAQTAGDGNEIISPKTAKIIEEPNQGFYNTDAIAKFLEQREEQRKIAEEQAKAAARAATQAQQKTVAQPAKKPVASKPAAAAPAKPNYDRLIIPKIGLNAQLVTMGRVNNAPGVHNTLPAWFNESSRAGTRDGKYAASFITGHNSGIFRRLGELAVGDAITVSFAGGEEYTYTVRKTEIRSFDDAQLMSDALGSTSCGGGNQCLNLMTCAGFHDTSIGTSTQRLVVYATR